MSKSGFLGFSLLFGGALFIILGYTNIEAEPINITIEHESENSTAVGILAKPIVEQMYVEGKTKLVENLKNKSLSTKDATEAANISAAFDSVACMDRSMEGYPRLIEIIDGQKMDAKEIYNTMEENCVIDSLVNIKNNIPERFDSAKKLFEDVGFKIADLKDF